MDTNLEITGPEEDSALMDRRAVAVATFALMEKLESGRGLRAPSIAKVFRLYCVEGMSAAQVARECRCSKGAVVRRLRLIRRKTGISARMLRRQESGLKSLDEIVPGFEVGRAGVDNLFYGGGRERE
jgi:DNA-directed RNA polymerase specialized sigma24 family protein